MNCLSFCFLGKLYLATLLSKVFSVGSFFLSELRIWTHFLMACKFSAENPLRAKYVWQHQVQGGMWLIASGHCLRVHSIDNYMVSWVNTAWCLLRLQLRTRASTGSGQSQWYTHTLLWGTNAGVCVMAGSGFKNACSGGGQGRWQAPRLPTGVLAAAGALALGMYYCGGCVLP